MISFSRLRQEGQGDCGEIVGRFYIGARANAILIRPIRALA
jgi:hypothetical protein